MPIDLSQLTPQDIEQLRALLLPDAAQPERMNEFDLNKPPTKPYVFQAFPRCIYHSVTGASKLVKNAAELEAHLENGFQREPLASKDADSGPLLDADTAAEAAEVDKVLRHKAAKK